MSMTDSERNLLNALVSKSEADGKVIGALSSAVQQQHQRLEAFDKILKALGVALDAQNKLIESHANLKETQVYDLMERMSDVEGKLGGK